MSKKPSKKATQPLGKPREVPAAASSATSAQSQHQTVKGPETRPSQSADKQDQPSNDGVSDPTGIQPGPPPNLRTRSDIQKWKEVENASKAIQDQLTKIRSLFPTTQIKRSARDSQQPGRKKESRNIVKDIDEFYSALAQDGQFKAVGQKEGLDSDSDSSSEFTFNTGGAILRYMRRDFEKKLGTDVEKVIQGGMSLTLDDGDEGAEGNDARPSGDLNSDIETAVLAKVDVLESAIEEVGELVEKKIVSQSFSTVRRKDYGRLGIRDEGEIAAMTLCQRVIGGLASNRPIKANFEITWKNVLEQMEERVVKTIDNFWNILSEESTRLLINDIKYCLVSAAVMTLGGRTQVLCFPEFSLGSVPRSNAKEDVAREGTAVEIKNKDGHTTRLSGSTDYFTFSVTKQTLLKDFKVERSSWGGSTVELYERVAEHWASKFHAGGFVIVEAKSPLTRLETHIPQVVAEAIALGSRRQKDYVPFCLTSGTHWIFGMVFCNVAERLVRRTEPMPFRPTRGGILLVITLLLSWVSMDPDDIWDLLRSED